MAEFKTRARALDMLGRQQIAGIPTAISELFKNAHDAYADHVEIDYYRSDGLFVLRDDGLGMTEREFTERWLTIGTESRLNVDNTDPYLVQRGKRRRPMLGEKGIGRLAIAAIAPQVLVLTRARRLDTFSDLTGAFINWSLFECPGVDLEDIRIPIRTFPGGNLPSSEDVSEMVADFRRNNERLKAKIDHTYSERLDRELQQFTVNPQELERNLGPPTLSGSESGTHFFLLPASDLLPEDIDGDSNDDKATPLTKALLGFANTLPISRSDPVIRAAFRDYKYDETYDDLISDREFFTRDEFRNADHQIVGRFDEHGQFTGDVSIYADTTSQHIIPWRNPSGATTDCGPFQISFAAIEGEARHSTLPPHEYSLMDSKTRKLGGLYIYRDGIRVLPYGDTEYDWLDIEIRRTKGMGFYYFSHRKMFGVIEIDSARNKQLREKAGREGFQENRAYRQFRSILRHFFVQLAADFFRSEGTYGDSFAVRKKELDKVERDRRRRAQLVSVKRRQLTNELNTFFQRVDNDEPKEKALQLSQDIADDLKRAIAISDRQQAATDVVRVEQRARAELQNLESRYRISRPRIALTKVLQKEWHDYATTFDDLKRNVFRETHELIESIVSEEAARARLEIDRWLRVETALNELATQARRNTKARGTETREMAHEMAIRIHNVTRLCIKEVESELRSVISEFQRFHVSELTNDAFVAAREELESRIHRVWETQSERLESIRSQLETIDPTGYTSALDQLVAVEQQNIALEEERDIDLQLSQLGMAVEIINHEFTATVRSLRNNLRRLKAWADVNHDLDELYHNIRDSFDHLDGYLTLFTPLHRRLYRKAVPFSGSEIYSFLRDLFGERLTRHKVQLTRTRSFSEFTIIGFPSSFYPVFVNLIDNAIFWMSQQNATLERTLELDVAREAFHIRDTGPGVNLRDRESIFENGFTRKPGGRGMGLSISRDTLRRVGYNLTLATPDGRRGTTFVISPEDQLDTEGAEIGQ